MAKTRKLTQDEIDLMERCGCRAENWEYVEVAIGFDASRVRFAHFAGRVRIGDNRGFLTTGGAERACGISHASLADCSVGKNVLIHRTGTFIRNYLIEDEVVIEDVSVLETEKGARFGSGEVVNVVNEAGGRQIMLFRELSAQVAYLHVFYRHDTEFQQRLEELIQEEIKRNVPETGRIGRGASLRGCRIIRNVCVGPAAILQGAGELADGTVLSCPEHPTVIGSGVILKKFIVSEGAHIESGACMERVLAGQGTQAGNHVSVEDSLLFANCEAFNSEICSVFAGPYTVTHHRSTLLIAGLWSFFNAGSGTNQSNHMYKLGPVHQGVFERGCKSGSFSYNMMECHVAPFTVIIGKHMANVNTSPFPFSVLTELDSRSNLLPALNLYSIGTIRDETKWLARDRRKCPRKRDLIVFDVFSPYTVERMRIGRGILQELLDKAPRRAAWVYYGGAQIKRLFLKKSIHLYTLAIDRYLIGKVIEAVEKTLPSSSTWRELVQHLQEYETGTDSGKWLDMAGLITPLDRVERIVEDVRCGKIHELPQLFARLEELYSSYGRDEIAYVCAAFRAEYGVSASEMSAEKFMGLVQRWHFAAISLNALSQESMKSEFSESARISYGLDQDEERKQRDFTAVRGSIGENPVNAALLKESERIIQRTERLRRLIGMFTGPG